MTEPQETPSPDAGRTGSHRESMRRVAPDEKLPFTRHLEELRWRIIHAAVTVMAAFMVLYGISDALFAYVRRPMGDFELISIAPTEAFFAYVKVSFYGAVMVSMPMILYQAWEFVAPGLLDAERRYSGAFVLFGSLFFALGAAFCYFLVLPLGIRFLLTFGSGQIIPQIAVGNYLSFLFTMLITFGLIFQLPIVIVLLTRMGVVTPETLAAQRAYFVVGAFIVAAILTPPDVFSQVLMALPMLALFEISLVVARLFVQKGTEDDS